MYFICLESRISTRGARTFIVGGKVLLIVRKGPEPPVIIPCGNLMKYFAEVSKNYLKNVFIIVLYFDERVLTDEEVCRHRGEA